MVKEEADTLKSDAGRPGYQKGLISLLHVTRRKIESVI